MPHVPDSFPRPQGDDAEPTWPQWSQLLLPPATPPAEYQATLGTAPLLCCSLLLLLVRLLGGAAGGAATRACSS